MTRHGHAPVVSRHANRASSASVTILEIEGDMSPSRSGKLRRSRKGPLRAVSVV